MKERLESCYQSYKQKINFRPQIGIVLGSGLGGFCDAIKPEYVLPYTEIAGFPTSTAPGHKGQFIFAHMQDTPVVLMQGRVHYYEGYSMEDVVLPIRLMGRMGIEVLILTNAAGGINTGFRPGDFMVIRDQISSFVPSPLVGQNPEGLGVRFPDMTCIYDERLRELIFAAGADAGVSLQEGIYLQTTGPQFETPAEIQMFRLMGADAVGMSTCCEAIAARHMGLRVCGISCISNLAAGMGNALLTAEDVSTTADQVGTSFARLLWGMVAKFQLAGVLQQEERT